MFTNLTALYEDWNHVIVTAHRGASGCYPENTALAMRKAVAWGADMIEFDLRTTLDGIPFILHDNSLDRTSNLPGRSGRSKAQIFAGLNIFSYICPLFSRTRA